MEGEVLHIPGIVVFLGFIAAAVIGMYFLNTPRTGEAWRRAQNRERARQEAELQLQEEAAKKREQLEEQIFRRLEGYAE